MQNESSRLQKLLHTQIAKMDGEELVYLLQSFSKGEPEHHEPAPVQLHRFSDAASPLQAVSREVG